MACDCCTCGILLTARPGIVTLIDSSAETSLFSQKWRNCFSPSVSMIFISSNTLSLKFVLSWFAQDSEFLQHERVTNNSLLKTVNISSETFLKGYRIFMVTLYLVPTIHIVLFKFVFSDNRWQFMDAKTLSC